MARKEHGRQREQQVQRPCGRKVSRVLGSDGGQSSGVAGEKKQRGRGERQGAGHAVLRRAGKEATFFI